MYDLAEAAVDAALAAGARYADARVMDLPCRVDGGPQRRRRVTRPDRARRPRRARPGRLLVGLLRRARSPTPPPRAGRARAAAVARASARVPGPPIELAPVQPVQGAWSSECLEDPFAVALAEKGDLLVGVTAHDAAPHGVGRRRGAVRRSGTPASGSSPARARGSTSTSASAAPAMQCTCRRRGRDAAPLVPGLPRPVRHTRLGAGRARWTCPARRADRGGGAGAARRAAVPAPARPT